MYKISFISLVLLMIAIPFTSAFQYTSNAELGGVRVFYPSGPNSDNIFFERLQNEFGDDQLYVDTVENPSAYKRVYFIRAEDLPRALRALAAKDTVYRTSVAGSGFLKFAVIGIPA